MNGDYVTIRHVDNGFTVEMNEYSHGKQTAKLVAKDEAELYEIIKGLFPADGVRAKPYSGKK